ncbi:MAG: HEAT repeat domain-containing protein [Vicinamibacterales bacterium]
MKRMSLMFAVLALLPTVAASQSAPPPPPPPQPPPAPQRPVVAPAPVAPVAPLPPLPPDLRELTIEPMIAPLAPVPSIEMVDPQMIEDAVRAARDQMRSLDIEGLRAEALARAESMRGDAQAAAREAREAALDAAQTWRMDAERNMDFNRAWAEAPEVVWEPFRFGFGVGDQSSDAGAYNSAMSALGSRNYDSAVTRFDRVIAQKGEHADGALYWKAFAQFKLGRTSDALASIAQLRKEYAQSRYLGDAKVLEADAKSAAGQPVNPAAVDDEELKILAIQGIQRADPAAAIPLLEGVLNSTNALRVKQRALYVLALSDQPGAHDILMRFAKGGGNPDLQRVAISYIASRRDRQTTSADLREIYNSTDDTSVRLAIISAYREAGDKNAIIAIAGNANVPVVLRSSAVGNLSSLAAPQDVWSLYQNESNPELRQRMLSVLNSMKAVDQLSQAARTDRDAEVRARAVRYLGSQPVDRTGSTLVALYSSDQDEGVRKAVISALASQDNAEGLVSIARKEQSLDLTREIVSRLSNMAAKSKVAADYLMEIIKR